MLGFGYYRTKNNLKAIVTVEDENTISGHIPVYGYGMLISLIWDYMGNCLNNSTEYNLIGEYNGR